MINKFLQYISKMRPQLPEDQGSQQHHAYGKYPEPYIDIAHFPKPFVINKAVAITFNYVVHRIDFENPLIVFWNQLQTPKNRCAPKSKLNTHGHKLADILHKDHEGGSKQRHTEYQAYTTKKIVKNLQIVDIGPIAIATEHEEKHCHKEAMYQQCR
ncbi:MAG: hypothetical protein SPI64_07875 [Anaerovibrio sp.]|nr:hypothetical protein [Anaerovibrio sp.]